MVAAAPGPGRSVSFTSSTDKRQVLHLTLGLELGRVVAQEPILCPLVAGSRRGEPHMERDEGRVVSPKAQEWEWVGAGRP